RVTDESLEELLPVRTTRVTLAHLMQHLVNHSTYHRGQVAMMVRQLGGEPLATDFHVFLVEDGGGAAVGQETRRGSGSSASRRWRCTPVNFRSARHPFRMAHFARAARPRT